MAISPPLTFSEPSREPSPPIGRSQQPDPWDPDTRKGKDSKEDQKPNEQTAVELLNRHAPAIAGSDRTKLNRATLAALNRGWTPADVAAELAKPTTGLANIAFGLIARMKALADQEPPPAPVVPHLRDLAPCPLHHGRRALNCGLCWGTVKGGDDPYEGREGLRPDGWGDVYGPPRQRMPEPDDELGTGAAPPPADIAQINAFLDD